MASAAWGRSSEFDTLLRQGLLALNRGELAAAAGSLEQASRLQPNDARVWLALAQTYQKSGRPELAEQAIASARRLALDDPIILRGLSLFFSESQRWADAAAAESRYAERAPTDPDAYPRATAFYLQANQPKAAIEVARKAPHAARRADLHDLMGKAYAQDGQPGAAEREFAEAIRLDPHDETYRFDLAEALLQRQDFGAALEVLEAAKKIFDQSPQIELALGVALYGQRRFADAADAFLRTTSLAPGLEQPYIFLGRMLDQAPDRLPEVTARFAAFEAAHPENYLGPFLHAKALAAQLPASADTTPVAALLERSIALNSRFWESHLQLGVLFEQQRNFARAAESLERAARLNPRSSAVHYHLARVYDRLDRRDQAAQERALHQKYAGEEVIGGPPAPGRERP